MKIANNNIEQRRKKATPLKVNILERKRRWVHELMSGNPPQMDLFNKKTSSDSTKENLFFGVGVGGIN